MLSQTFRRVGRHLCSSFRNAPLRSSQPQQELRRSFSLRYYNSAASRRLEGSLSFNGSHSVRSKSTKAGAAKLASGAAVEEEDAELQEQEYGLAGDLSDYRPAYIDDAQAAAIVERAKQVWPCPSGPIPSGWSCEWEKWPLLFSLYWFSPYYLMLPQVEMIVNIMFAVPGEARPILYYTPQTKDGTGRDLFLFTIVKPEEEEAEFYLCDCSQMDLYKIAVPGATEERLVSMLGSELGSEGSMPSCMPPMEKLEASAEGLDAIRRILERDESVIPVLAERFLGYVPEATEEWQERPGGVEGEGAAGKTEEENLEELSRLVEEVVKRSPEMREVSDAFDRGLLKGGENVDADGVEEALGLTNELGELEEMMRDAAGDLEKLERKARNTDGESDDLGELADVHLKAQRRELQVEEGHVKTE